VDKLPEPFRSQVTASGFSDDFVRNNYDALERSAWEDIDVVKGFLTFPEDFNTALEYFANPELRIRADCMVLSGMCPPDQIADALRGWSKYKFSEQAAKVFCFYFCNVAVMRSFDAWKRYIDTFSDPAHKWLLSEAYDVQTKGDLLVLMDDLSIRAALNINPEDTVQDLMVSSFIHLKKEERKIAEGVPAKSTAVFEWASMYCSMFDRLQKVLETVDKESALDTVKTRLVQVREGKPRKLSDYPLAGKAG
jgi:hypothetical protein